MTTILVGLGDTHINSTMGLCVPVANLDDGGTFRISQEQRFLWNSWLDFWKYVQELSVQHNADVWTVLNGDVVDKDMKRRSYQTITQNTATINSIAVSTLDECLRISTRVFMIRGTPAHVGKSSSLEEALANDIGAEKCEARKTYSWWELNLKCDGVLFEVMHHGPMGRTEWTRPNALNSLAVRIMLERKQLPNVVLRSHNHRFGETGSNYPVRVVALPAWQLPSEIYYRAGIVERADIGGVIFLCDHGKYQMQVKMYQLPPSKVWALRREI